MWSGCTFHHSYELFLALPVISLVFNSIHCVILKQYCF